MHFWGNCTIDGFNERKPQLLDGYTTEQHTSERYLAIFEIVGPNLKFTSSKVRLRITQWNPFFPMRRSDSSLNFTFSLVLTRNIPNRTVITSRIQKKKNLFNFRKTTAVFCNATHSPLDGDLGRFGRAVKNLTLKV